MRCLSISRKNTLKAGSAQNKQKSLPGAERHFKLLFLPFSGKVIHFTFLNPAIYFKKERLPQLCRSLYNAYTKIIYAIH
jgi:hypothetical protein